MVQTGKSRKDFGGFSGAGGSGTGKETEVTDDFCLDIDTNLGGEEVIADKEKETEMKLIDKEVEEEQLVDYDSEPEYYETEEKEMIDLHLLLWSWLSYIRSKSKAIVSSLSNGPDLSCWKAK
ncbi:hypothetical protein QVD17_30436 [Tagetes erecta]|uniref:Uncharacterized protein n=1 Tax=Tagetes erecta TaxID=13708 RepID=A0AAD8K5B7_TARER|nr:hypothetical protein QVD17_30436 [Tagetes erecta]